MTLILSCLTQNYVLQVSDRQLTRITSDGKTEPLDDPANKAVLFDYRVAFAYTGLANIQGQKTDDWLTYTLIHANANTLIEACEAVRARATAAFRGIPLPARMKSHTFIGVGWIYTGVSEDPSPVGLSITNYYCAPGERHEMVHPEFKGFCTILTEPMMWTSTGQPLNEHYTTQLHRVLSRMQYRGVHAPTVARFLVNAIREVAKTNKSVGKNLMISYIPKSAVTAVRSEWMLIPAGVFRPDMMSFLYLSEGSSDPTYYGPNIVTPNAAFFGFRAEP